MMQVVHLSIYKRMRRLVVCLHFSDVVSSHQPDPAHSLHPPPTHPVRAPAACTAKAAVHELPHPTLRPEAPRLPDRPILLFDLLRARFGLHLPRSFSRGVLRRLRGPFTEPHRFALSQRPLLDLDDASELVALSIAPVEHSRTGSVAAWWRLGSASPVPFAVLRFATRSPPLDSSWCSVHLRPLTYVGEDGEGLSGMVERGASHVRRYSVVVITWDSEGCSQNPGSSPGGALNYFVMSFFVSLCTSCYEFCCTVTPTRCV
ncbi:hypothetical protein C8Q76DRAFT_753044 [Earliella scabrosa]|nr:hypothetical protein C8Q76DRAFT_753044 [Earliella scabrosa]